MTTTGSANEVGVPDPPQIPALRFRRVDLDADVDGLVALINESSIVDGTEMAFSVDDVRHDLSHKANFDIERDVVVAELDGRVAGEVEVNVVVRDGIAVHSYVGWVHPDARRRGIGRSLARWVDSLGTVKILGGSYTENVDATAKAVVLSPGASPAQVSITGNMTFPSDTVTRRVRELSVA